MSSRLANVSRLLFTLASIQAGSLLQADAPQMIWNYEALHGPSMESAAEQGEALTIYANGRRYEVELEPANLRSGSFVSVEIAESGVREIAPQRSRTFRGRVVGDPQSTVRLSFGDSGVRGLISSGGTNVFVEPYSLATYSSTGWSYHKLASLEDSAIDFRALCDHAAAEIMDSGGSGASETDTPDHASSELHRVAEIFVEADYELWLRHGSETEAFVESVINNVSGIYETELGVSLRLAGIRVWRTSSDPFVSTEATDLLLDLRDYWQAREQGTKRDVVHLITGRNLDGYTVGYAGVGVLCSDRWGYGLSEDLESLSWTSLVVAHELGHNFGADHDTSSSNYLMTPSLGSGTLREFSELSRLEIQAHLDDVDCLETPSETAPPGPETDPAPPPESELAHFVRGDMNGDGVTDVADAIGTLDYLFRGGPAGDCLDALDADDNGEVDLSDAMRVIQHILLGGGPPAAPYPNAGPDGTPDLLPRCLR